MWRKGNPSALLVGMKTGVATVENSTEFPQKIKNKRFHLFIFRENGREKEGERNINVLLPLVHLLLGTWPVTQACALTGK